jgi:type VI secretion system protein VasD
MITGGARAGGVAALLALAGCALLGGGDSTPAPIDVEIESSVRLNPDESGQSLPTQVRLLQLKSGGKLEAADFGALYRGDKEALGEDLLQVDEVVVSPGEKVQKRVGRDRAATVLGIVGVFRRPSGGTWRRMGELPRGGKAVRVRVRLEDYRVESN